MINFSLEAYRVHANNWGERCSHHYFEISPRLIQTTFQEFFCIFTVCLICTLLYVHVGGVVVSRCWNQSWVLWRTASTLSHCSIAPAPYGYIFCSCRPVYASSVLAPHLFLGGFLELGSTGFANLVPILRRVTQCPPQACFLVRFCFTQKEGVRSPHLQHSTVLRREESSRISCPPKHHRQVFPTLRCHHCLIWPSS